MRKISISFCLLLSLYVTGYPQKVSNVQYQFSGNQLLITYDLSGEPGTVWRTEVYLSEDDGITWGSPLMKVNGDVGDSIVPGPNKKIYWDRYAEGKEILKKVVFMVIATPDEFYASNSGVFKDVRSGTDYKWVRIGAQVWMAENLNFGYLMSGNEHQTDNKQVEKYCYNNLEINCIVYGGLYQWDEMMQYSTIQGTKGICPDNWHIPSETEWEELIYFLGGRANAYGRIKELGNTHWNIRSKGTTNDTDFSVLPGGVCSPDTMSVCFKNLKNDAYFWSSTERDQSSAYGVGLGNLFLEIYNFTGIKTNGYSVRCIKD